MSHLLLPITLQQNGCQELLVMGLYPETQIGQEFWRDAVIWAEAHYSRSVTGWCYTFQVDSGEKEGVRRPKV